MKTGNLRIGQSPKRGRRWRGDDDEEDEEDVEEDEDDQPGLLPPQRLVKI